MNLPQAASQRLFLALWPDAMLRSALEAHAASWRWPATARRTDAGHLHLTLHFLGNVATTTLPALRDGLDVAWPGCEMLLDRVALWPGGIAVLEAGGVPPQLARLHAALGEKLAGLGMAVETRRFRPHVTLARKAAGALPPERFAALPWSAGPAYLLVRSLPGGRGYQPVQAFG